MRFTRPERRAERARPETRMCKWLLGEQQLPVGQLTRHKSPL